MPAVGTVSSPRRLHNGPALPDLRCRTCTAKLRCRTCTAKLRCRTCTAGLHGQTALPDCTGIARRTRVWRVRLLVTGGLGFIGSHVVEQALDVGHEVRVLDVRDIASAAAAPDCADIIAAMSHVDFHLGDVRDPAAMSDALAGIDAVIHLAAKVGLGNGVSDAVEYVSTNEVGTAMLAQSAAAGTVEKIVQASSMVVYGPGLGYCPTHGLTAPAPRRAQDLAVQMFEAYCAECAVELAGALIDEQAPMAPANVYAASKVSQEMLIDIWAKVTAGTAVNLRFHNVYGRRLPLDTPYAGVAALFVSMLKNGHAPQVFEDGHQRRDFVHVRDVARACIAALEVAHPHRVSAYNVGSGTPRTVLDMAQSLAMAVGGKSPEVTGQYRVGDVRHITASSQLAADELDWRAVEDFDSGMAEMASASSDS